MCGIAGFYNVKSDQILAERNSLLGRFLSSIAHRGPDSEGRWHDDNSGVSIGQRRLSIIDLSETGNQPMLSHSERYIIVYNGEIYNFKSIRNDLKLLDVKFKGRSDTEVLLSAIEQWGLNTTLQKINGMFAFALWDRVERKLSFARDRFGKKPLYIGWAGQDLVFGSELKIFHQHADFKPKMSKRGFEFYQSYGYIHAPHTIFDTVWQLMPGTSLVIEVDKLKTDFDFIASMIPFWSLERVVNEGRRDLSDQSDQMLIEQFERKLDNAVLERMISDVPLGAFLSGGIDSSTVVSVMQKHSPRPVKTFSIGFEEKAYNEAVYAKDIAQHLGTDHTEFYVTQDEALDVISSLPDMYDEPFADSSQIPTYLVSKMARRHVTVALTGDGGDEILAGYDRHVKVAPLWEKVKFIPHPLRQMLMGAAGAVPDSVYAAFKPDNPYFAAKVKRSFQLLKSKNMDALYQSLLTVDGSTFNRELFPRNLDALHHMLYGDMTIYRPHDLMTKADRASMAASLEARAPLMDHALAEFCWHLPTRMKVRNGQGKWLLRQILRQYVPTKLFERPKMGFSVPLDQWLKKDLQDWGESLLSQSALNDHDLYDTDKVIQKWNDFKENPSVQEVPKDLWSVLMFQAWYKRWMK